MEIRKYMQRFPKTLRESMTEASSSGSDEIQSKRLKHDKDRCVIPRFKIFKTTI